MGLFDILRAKTQYTEVTDFRGGEWHRKRISDRLTDELIGMCRGILLDGAVDQGEARGLLKWLEGNKAALDQWPGNAIYARLIDALSDDKLDGSEEKTLLTLLLQATGNQHANDPLQHVPAELPWDEPAPPIVHEASRFVLTGDFVRAPRHQIEQMIVSRGGQCTASVSRKTNYVIVGLNGSNEWKHAGFGTKIQKAMELKQQGYQLAIASEKHWLQFTE